MANLDELIQKLSEKSKTLTYDSGRLLLDCKDIK